MRKTRKWAALLFVPVLATACMGPFNLTRKYNHWNETATSNRWANEGIFVGSVIIPVYQICMLADAIVLNSIEWWGGNNPVDPPNRTLPPMK